MRLYLHNFLQDNADGQIHYPLKIIPTQVKDEPGEFNLEMMENFIKRIDFMALAGACNDLGIKFTVPEDLEHFDEEQLKELHHLLFEVEVVSGELVSPSGKRFPIVSGIPDMCPQNQQQQQQEEEGVKEGDE